MRKIEVFDTTLRDGEQSAGVNLHPHEKLEIALQLERYGVDVMEAGFPASSQGEFEAVSEISRVVQGAQVAALARSTERDIDAVRDALKRASSPRIHLFLATSPIHMADKLRLSPDQVVDTAVASVRYAAKYFSDIEWSAEDATRSDWGFLSRIIEAVIAAGATVVNLPDTVGYTTPGEYKNLFEYVQKHVGNIHKVKMSAHCHDDLGLAVVNTLAAIEQGVDQIEGTINGIGERAGNAALEEIAVALAIRKDIYGVSTQLDLAQTTRTSQLVSRLTGMLIPPNKAVVGKNAFAHESGIHQDGVLKNTATYEIIRPELVGLSSNTMAIGKHSGRHALREKCRALNLDLTEDEFLALFAAVKELTGHKKVVTDDDIVALALDWGGKDATANELESLHVSYDEKSISMTTVGIKLPDGSIIREAATGNGSVEAIYNTIERVLGTPVELMDYRIQSTTGGKDALAEVYVKVRYLGRVSSGRSVHSDVLSASAKAFLDATNRVSSLISSSTQLETAH
jgi:2-isopropylmalate synthase